MQRSILTEEQLISGLFANDTLNQLVSEFKNNIQNNPKSHEANIKSLIQAIKSGDEHAAIWSNKDCYLYLLHLIKEKQVSFWQGVSTYVMLIVEMQFTLKQQLSANDEDTKSIRTIQIHPLAKNGALTSYGKDYLKSVCLQFKNQLGINLDYQDLISDILNLSPIEQWSISIEGDWLDPNEIENIFKLIAHNLPFCVDTDLNRNVGTVLCTIPSISLINLFLQKMRAEPLQMKPVFGAIDTAMRYQHHQLDQEILPLYAPGIKGNAVEIDDNRCGPFLIYLYQIGHAFWGSMLSCNERKMLYDAVIPLFNTMLQKALKMNDAKAASEIQYILDFLNDYNLTNIMRYGEAQTRFEKYVLTAISRRITQLGIFDYTRKCDEPLGNTVDDALFYLFVNTILETEPNKEFWSTILNQSIKYGKDRREREVVLALLQLNDLVDPIKTPPASFFKNKQSEIDLLAWRQILNSNKTSLEIWNDAVKDRPRELLCLIRQHNLKFYEPYITLSTNERNRIIKLIDFKLNESKTFLKPVMKSM